MRTVSRVARNSLALMSGQVYGVVINLLAISIIARYLSLAIFGEYGFVLAVCVTLGMFADMGINRVAIREIAREGDRDKEIRILTAVVMNKVLLSLVSFGAIVFVVWVVSGSSRMLFATILCAFATIIKILGDIPEAIFKAYERMRNNALLKIVEDTSYILGILVVVAFDLGLIGIFTALLISAVIRVLLGIGILSRGYFLPGFGWDPNLMKWIFREALPIGFNRVFRKAALRIDTIILNLFRTPQEVGIFHGVYRIILIASILPFNITEALFPVYSRYAQDSQEALRVVFEKSFKFLLILVLPLVLVLFVLAQPLVHLFLGDKFLTAAPLMQILVFLLGFRFFTILCTKVLNASNQQKRAARASGLALGINIILDFLLIWLYGYMGAAVATLISDMVLFAASMVYVRRHVCPFELGPIVTKPLGLIILAGGAAFCLKPVNGFLALGVPLALYVFFLFAFKVFDDDELDVMWRGVRRFQFRLQKADFSDADG